MKTMMRLMAIAILIAAPAALAQTPEYSAFPVDEPTDVGGTILQPGQYLIRVLPSRFNRNQVQITDPDRTKVYATVLTVPHAFEPGETRPDALFIYYPAGDGAPRALRTWFAPNPVASQGGHDIVYEEDRAKQLARLASTRVVSYGNDVEVAQLENTELHVVTPEATVETYTYTAPTTTTTTTTTTATTADRDVETETTTTTHRMTTKD